MNEQWDENQHPRHPKGTPVGGQFASKGGGSAVGGGAPRVGGDPGNPSHWYLPSDEKGEWLSGKKGEGVFRLKTPVEADGKLVRDITFTRGVPHLDEFSLPGHAPTIILTGDRNLDRANARSAWGKLNPGSQLPGDAVFHHDLLSTTIEKATVDGKQVNVVVGKMQLVPAKINEAVFHQGSLRAWGQN